MTKLQEQRLLRLFRVILKEAGPVPPEEDDEMERDPEAEPVNVPGKPAPANMAPANKPVNVKPVNKAPVNAPPPEAANAPVNAPSNAPANVPVNKASNAAPPPANAPDVEIPGMDNPDVEPDANAAATNADDKVRQAKVKLFFDKLASNDVLMNYLQFKSPLEQAEAIQKFAEMVGVPRGQLMNVLNSIRKSAANAPQVESVGCKEKIREAYKRGLLKNKDK